MNGALQNRQRPPGKTTPATTTAADPTQPTQIMPVPGVEGDAG